ncbi:MAG: isopentenyl-diphosphate Delta-isomerase [Opitutaceae bacterium]|nr:isopentenyl-diphosphate Delta-isomerase [Opitutaceae bacterium]
MTEQLILVDARNRPIGTADKREVHRAGLRHRAFSIFLVDDGGRLLLQRRQVSKYHSGGLWSNSCCGHPRSGERTIDAARRRLAEELGATTKLRYGFQARYRATFPNGLKENEIVSVYFGAVPEGIMPNPDEVASVVRCSLAQLEQDVRRQPAGYSFWLTYYLQHHRRALADGVRVLVKRGPGRPANVKA